MSVIHLYRCFAFSTDDAVTVAAASHEDAAKKASERKGWDVEQTVTVYMKSVIGAGNDPSEPEASRIRRFCETLR